ncbi:MAG: WD40 repeat domain-containing protein, partial [Planctomycetes bacterium]|nr:WD40 repeat domain-containing protein [Planctomycetota bacterium]
RHPSVAFAAGFIALTAIVGSFVVASLERSSRLRTEAESERARALGYVANITAAHVEYQKSYNPIAARERLLASDASLRDFEWYLLAAATRPHGRAFPGHEGGVRSFCWSEDSTRIATLSMAFELTVFEAQSAKVVHRRPSHGGTRVQMWPGHDAFVVDMPDGSIELRSFRDGSILRKVKIGDVPAVAMCFTKDGSRLLAALDDRRLILIDFSESEEPNITTIGVAARHVTELACGDSHFAVAHLGAEVELWKWGDSKRQCLLGAHAFVHGVAFDPTGRWLVASAATGILVFDTDDRVNIQRPYKISDLGGGRPIDMGPRGDRIASSYFERGVAVWPFVPTQPSNVLKPLRFRGHGSGVQIVRFDASGRWVATSSWDDELRVFDTQEPESLSWSIVLPSAGYRTKYVTNERVLCSDWRGNLRVFEIGERASSKSRTLPKHHASRIVGLIELDEGKRWMTADLSGSIMTWDADAETADASARSLDSEILAITKYDEERAIAATADGRLHEVPRNAAPREISRLESSATAIARLPGTSLLVVGDIDGEVALIDAANGQELWRTETNNTWISTVAVAPDGSWFAHAGDSCRIEVVDARSRARRHELFGHTRTPLSMIVSPNGNRIFSCGGYERTLRIYDPHIGRELLALETDHGALFDLDLDSSGERLVAAAMSRRLVVFDAPRKDVAWELDVSPPVRIDSITRPPKERTK